MKRICIVVASDMTITSFLMLHLAALCKHYEVTVVANTRADLLATSGLDVRVIPVAIQREISPWLDLLALWHLWRLFRRERFASVHSITPKAGLLAMVAGWLARVPVRIHSFSGQVWATRRGVMRGLLKSMDKITVMSATHLISDSESQCSFLEQEGVIRAEKVVVPAKGSISGVNLQRFHPDVQRRASVRQDLAIDDSTLLFLFLGRLKRDKGVLDLAKAFCRFVPQATRDVAMLIVGPDEDGLQDELAALAENCAGRIHILPFTSHPEHFMMSADVFCLPSYRESFGITVVEAAACGIPAIGSRVYGITDAIVEQETGSLFTPGDIDDLARKMAEMQDASKRLPMGERARKRAESDFSSDRVTAAWLDFYEANV